MAKPATAPRTYHCSLCLVGEHCQGASNGGECECDCKYPDCESCGGLGFHNVGDCEDGVIDDCPGCNETGKIELL